MSLPEYMAPSRPLGIAILSVLHCIGGVILAVLAVAFPVFAAKEPELREVLSSIGVPFPLLIVGIVVLVALTLGSGIGMWIGAKWGWYLGSFYYVYSVIRSILAIYNTHLLFETLPPDEVAAMPRGIEFYYFKFGFRAVVHALIYLYFFKVNVLEYFGLKEISRWKVVVIESGICVAIAVAASLLIRSG